MKKTIHALTLLLTLLCASCGTGSSQPPTQEQTESAPPAPSIGKLRPLTIRDSVTVQGKTYQYTCALETDNSLPTLINPQGNEYYESRVTIDIAAGTSAVFHKTFHKNDFKDWLPHERLQAFTMIGVNYNVNRLDSDAAAFYFIITVGDPDTSSDTAYPLELTVAPDGSHSLQKAVNLDTGPIS